MAFIKKKNTNNPVIYVVEGELSSLSDIVLDSNVYELINSNLPVGAVFSPESGYLRNIGSSPVDYKDSQLLANLINITANVYDPTNWEIVAGQVPGGAVLYEPKPQASGKELIKCISEAIGAAPGLSQEEKFQYINLFSSLPDKSDPNQTWDIIKILENNTSQPLSQDRFDWVRDQIDNNPGVNGLSGFILQKFDEYSQSVEFS